MLWISLQEFKDSFETDGGDATFLQNGLFGYTSYNGVQYFEDIDLENKDTLIPEMMYGVYRFILAIDHFKNTMHVFEHIPEW